MADLRILLDNIVCTRCNGSTIEPCIQEIGKHPIAYNGADKRKRSAFLTVTAVHYVEVLVV